MKNECPVVMLPTEKATNIFKDSNGLLFFSDNYQIAKTINSDCKGYFIYILSDDEIKEGDWKYNEKLNCITQHLRVNKNLSQQLTQASKWCKKIIATNDKSLTVAYLGNQIYDSNKTPDHYGFKSGLGIQGRIVYKPLARPSNEFLKKYCDVGGIDKVLVKYREYIRSESSHNYDEDWIYCDGKVIETIYKEDKYDLSPKLEVAPDNTITIYPVSEEKEKIYSNKEVREMIDKAIESWSHDGYVDYDKIF